MAPRPPSRPAANTRAKNRRAPKAAPRIWWRRGPRKPLKPREVEALQYRRMVAVGVMLGGLVLGVLASCIQLQGCESDVFVEEAQRNYLRALRLDMQRGYIYDRNGEVLATSVDVDTVYANPIEVTDKAGTAQKLVEALHIPLEPVMRALTSGSHFRYIKRQVTAREAEAVRKLDLKGIDLNREAKRFYPKKTLGGQLLGAVGYDSVGIEGLERAWNSQLRGGQLVAPYYRDAKGHYAMMQGLPPIETRAGHSLQLTIDEKIQATAERELERACLSAQAVRGGIAVVMDVKTGEVLAMAHYPRFNPNRYRSQIREDQANRKAGRPGVQRARARAIVDQFEPGSTFKVFTLAAALEEGLVALDEKIDLEGGRYKVGRKYISDTHRFKEKRSVLDIIKYSSNIGCIKMGQRMGREMLHDYLVRFGFGAKTGVNFLGESAGLLRKPEEWAEITLANVAFGQGVAVTPLQLTTAVAALGNGGLLMRPRLVSALLDSDRRVLERYPAEVVRRVVSPGTARQVVLAMKGVVEYDGTGALAWTYDYDVAGKTGTAQKIDPIAGGYAEDRWVGSFIGLAPAERPRLAVLVAIDEPQGLVYGGVVAAPAFKAITEWTLNYLGVAPSYGSRERIQQRAILEKYGQEHGSAATTAEGAYYDWPEGQTPGTDAALPRRVSVPDFSDMSIRSAVKVAHDGLMWVDIDGTGLASGQSISPGSRVAPWTRVTVYFRPGDASDAKEDRP